MPARERLIIDTDEYGRVLVERQPAPDLIPFAGTGPDRGAWEEQHANDNSAAPPVRVEYEPPRARWS